MKSLCIKTPDNFKDRVLTYPQNKTCFVELLFQYVAENRKAILKL